MNSSHDGNAQAESRQLEVGTMREREVVCTGEFFRARANGFSPRSFCFRETIGCKCSGLCQKISTKKLAGKQKMVYVEFV